MFGIVDESGNYKIKPFRLIESREWRRRHQTNFSKAKFVFKYIVNNYCSMNDIEDLNLSSLTVTDWDDIFNQSFDHLIIQIQNKKAKMLKNPHGCTYVTIYEALKYS